MPQIYRQALIVCPPAQVERALQRFVAERARGEQVRIVLRPAVHVPELGSDIVMQRDVVVEMLAAHNAFPLRVSWAPADDGAFPRFDGSLWIEPAEGGQASRLVLHGTAPASPTSIAHRVSQAIGRDFLAHLTQYVAGNATAVAS